MAIEIVSFPIKNGGSFHSYVKLPEGNIYVPQLMEGITMTCITDIDSIARLKISLARQLARRCAQAGHRSWKGWGTCHGYPAGGLKIDAEDPPCVDNFPRESHWLSTSMLVYPRIFNILQVPQETSLVWTRTYWIYRCWDPFWTRCANWTHFPMQRWIGA